MGCPSRRNFLYGVGVASSSLAGCLGGSDEDSIQDSDGDGVIDSEDYAPQDPDVQEKSDVTNEQDQVSPTPTQTSVDDATATPTSKPSPEPTPTDTPTPSPTPTSVPSANTLQVTDEYWQEATHITEYSVDEVSAVIYESDVDVSYSSAKLWIDVQTFPRGERHAWGESSPFSLTDDGTVATVQLDRNDIPTGQRLQMAAYLLPGDKEAEDVSSDEWEYLMSSDPVSVRSDGATIERDPHPDGLSSDSGTGFERNVVEGAYDLQFSGRTGGRDWETSFLTWKGAYIQGIQRSRGRSRPEYVSYELTEGTAPGLAEILNDEAEANNYTGDREKVEFVIDFVQRLPYVTDDVSKGFDDYTKFIVETLTEANGDCEDTAILLASVLEAEPFGYDMILIQPPGHMAAGIWNSDPTGYYWELDGRKYAYIETTGEGWVIGDCPEDYQNARAQLHQV